MALKNTGATLSDYGHGESQQTPPPPVELLREGLQAQQFPASVQPPNLEKKLESLPSMVAGVWSTESALQLEATTQFRKLLSIERSPPIEEVIQAGVVPRFVEFLVREDYPQLQVGI